MENRIETLRRYIDNIIINKERGKFWFVERHMHAVSKFSAMLAIKRNLNPETATIIGLLHDIHTLITDDHIDHAALGAIKAAEILGELSIADAEESAVICTAIKNHSTKSTVDDAYSELVKDADVLTHYFFNVSLPVADWEKARLESLLAELSLSTDL